MQVNTSRHKTGVCNHLDQERTFLAASHLMNNWTPCTYLECRVLIRASSASCVCLAARLLISSKVYLALAEAVPSRLHQHEYMYPYLCARGRV